ncbi:hypothetical protein GUITHDRAFT_163256 [Guillardia theta CCMP2712]|uniref:Uncharacterized protein n=2 Tax=Guillardia theta TaxID=55529 RepID=L1JAN9_GUITC|nr:hypothetical protein GUITHDRAFT_163256 [Guillardia theta CCMP2712]EKX45367.1 hypothetical protein GUITHDRAFT_163256 [Guillardia theta CCMP2712]|eukprot:XP_005832347.1 hypothetical protein GUITHDRAFT_163256 [Guillardia theta CCMP2712]
MEASKGRGAASDQQARKGPIRYTGIVIALDSKYLGITSKEHALSKQDEMSTMIAHALQCEEQCQTDQIMVKAEDDAILVTMLDAVGPSAKSAKVLSQELLMQAFNPMSELYTVAKELFKEKRGARSEVKASQSASMLVEKSELDQLSQLMKDATSLSSLIELEVKELRSQLGSSVFQANGSQNAHHGSDLQSKLLEFENETDVMKRLESLREVSHQQSQHRATILSHFERALADTQADLKAKFARTPDHHGDRTQEKFAYFSDPRHNSKHETYPSFFSSPSVSNISSIRRRPWSTVEESSERQILKAKLPFRTEWEHQQDLADIKQKLDEVIPSSRFHDRSQKDSKDTRPSKDPHRDPLPDEKQEDTQDDFLQVVDERVSKLLGALDSVRKSLSPSK